MAIKTLREQKGLSQSVVAGELGMTRQTYAEIESEQRELRASEILKLAHLFEVSPVDILSGTSTEEPTVHLPVWVSAKSNPAWSMRIQVPQKKVRTFREVLLYVLERVGSRPHVDESVIEKLLYFADFDYYEQYEEQLLGATYVKRSDGPVPVELRKITEQMCEKGELESLRASPRGTRHRRFLPRRSADLAFLSGRDVAHVQNVLDRLGWMEGAELSAYAKMDLPWRATPKVGGKIEYETVFYREAPYATRRYEHDPL